MGAIHGAIHDEAECTRFVEMVAQLVDFGVALAETRGDAFAAVYMEDLLTEIRERITAARSWPGLRRSAA